jgi:hypothetical protein
MALSPCALFGLLSLLPAVSSQNVLDHDLHLEELEQVYQLLEQVHHLGQISDCTHYLNRR